MNPPQPPTATPTPGVAVPGPGRRRRTGHGQRGSGTVELAIATPLLLFMILAVVQVALWAHAAHVAQAVADQALTTTRVQGGTPAAGQAEADRTLAHLGRSVLHSPDVRITRTADTVRVQVHGTATRLLPGLSLSVAAASTGIVEKFRPVPARAGAASGQGPP